MFWFSMVMCGLRWVMLFIEWLFCGVVLSWFCEMLVDRFLFFEEKVCVRVEVFIVIVERLFVCVVLVFMFRLIDEGWFSCRYMLFCLVVVVLFLFVVILNGLFMCRFCVV